MKAERRPFAVDFLDQRWVEYTYFLQRRPTSEERFLDEPVLDRHSGHATILPHGKGYQMWYNSLVPHDVPAAAWTRRFPTESR